MNEQLLRPGMRRMSGTKVYKGDGEQRRTHRSGHPRCFLSQLAVAPHRRRRRRRLWSLFGCARKLGSTPAGSARHQPHDKLSAGRPAPYSRRWRAGQGGQIGDRIGTRRFIGNFNGHRRARHLGSRVGQELIQRSRIPDQVRVGHCGRVGVARERARFATDHTGQRGTEAVLTDDCGVTSCALVFKCGLTGYRVPGGVRGTCGEKQSKGNDEAGTPTSVAIACCS